MMVGSALHLQNGAGADIQLVFKDARERDNWFEALTRKVGLFLKQADAELEPELEPEEDSPVSVVNQDCLAAGQQHAAQAVERLEHWKHAVDHTALHQETDGHLARLRTRVEEIKKKKRFGEEAPIRRRSTLELREVERHISDIRAVLRVIHKCIGAERSARRNCSAQ